MGALSRWLHERRACVLRCSLAEPSATCTISNCQGPAHKCMQRSSAAECECGSTFTLLGILHSQLLAIPRPALAGWWPLPSGCAGGRWHPGSGCTCPACVLVVARIRATQLAHRRAHAPLHPQQVCCWMLACAVTSGLANNSCSCCGMLYAGLWQTRFFNWRPLRVLRPLRSLPTLRRSYIAEGPAVDPTATNVVWHPTRQRKRFKQHTSHFCDTWTVTFCLQPLGGISSVFHKRGAWCLHG